MADCNCCGKKIEKGDTFVLEGRYPSNWGVYAKSFDRWAPPTDYGDVYHKECYLKLQRKETQ